MLEKFYLIPILGGMALQIEPVISSNWAAMVGAGGVVLVAVVVTLDKLGLLKKFGNGDAASAAAQKELKNSLDGLGRKIDQLNATMNSQVMILGGLTSELKESVRVVGEVHKWIEIQEGVRQRMEGGGV